MPGRRHHIVPQFYLRQFADEDEQILLVDRDDLTRRHRSTVRRAATKTGFYRIEAADLAREADRLGHDPEFVESALAQLEGEMATAVRAALVDPPEVLTREHWYRLVQLVAIQTVRGQRWREDFAALATQELRVQVLSDGDDRIREFLKSRGDPHSDNDVAAFREGLFRRFPRVVPPQALMVQQSLRMALGDPLDDQEIGLSRYIANKQMTVIAPPTVAVTTSDEPVCWWSPGDGPTGYATAKFIWIPLSRSRILQFAESGADLAGAGLPDPGSPEGADVLAARVNVLVAAQATRWVIHHPDDSPLERVELPPRQVWGDQLVAVDEGDGQRRETYIHRRMLPATRQ